MDRESPSSEQRERFTPTRRPLEGPAPVVSAAVGLAFVGLFAIQAMSGPGAARALTFEPDRPLELWRLLTWPLAWPADAGFEGPAMRLFGLAFLALAPMAIVLVRLRGLERRIGPARLAAALALLTVSGALTATPMLLIYPELGRALGGPLGLALGLMSFHVFVCGDEEDLGALPVPFVFLILSALLLVCVVAISTDGRIDGRVISAVAALPAALCGGLVVLADRTLLRRSLRRRDQREIELVIEEVYARAEVDVLLGKITAHGMGSLTRSERLFLERASRFYRSDRHPPVRG